MWHYAFFMPNGIDTVCILHLQHVSILKSHVPSGWGPHETNGYRVGLHNCRGRGWGVRAEGFLPVEDRFRRCPLVLLWTPHPGQHMRGRGCTLDRWLWRKPKERWWRFDLEQCSRRGAWGENLPDILELQDLLWNTSNEERARNWRLCPAQVCSS